MKGGRDGRRLTEREKSKEKETEEEVELRDGSERMKDSEEAEKSSQDV